MNSDRFDLLARRIGGAAHRPVTRRSLLRALGLGGVASASVGKRATARQGRIPARERALHQSIGAGTVADQAFLLQYDANKIFRFVADEIVFEPYDGVLRGAEGTLRSRAGNAADKALLLGELLGASNIAVRYIIDRLSDANATAILASVSMAQADVDRHEALAIVGALSIDQNQALPSPATPTSGVDPALNEIGAARDAIFSYAAKAADESIEVLHSALKAAGSSLEPIALKLTDFQRANHVMVEYAFGTDWVRLDPSVPGSEPVKLPSAATPVSATPVANPENGALPETMYHTVTLRLVVEQTAGDSLATTDFVSQQYRVSDIADLPITVAHFGAQDLQGLGIAITSIVEGSFTQIPLVAVGDQVTQGSPYLVFGGGGGGILGSFGDGQDALADGEPTAEWLVIDINEPGAPPQTVSRVIFDRIGDAERTDPKTAIAGLKPIELVDYEDVGKCYPPLLAVTSLAISGSDLRAGRFGPQRAPDSGVEQQAIISHAVQFNLFRLITNMSRTYGFRAAPSGVNITSASFSARLDNTNMSPQLDVDVIRRRVMALPISDASPTVEPAVAIAALGQIAEELAVDPSGWSTTIDISQLALPEVPTPAVTIRSIFAAARSTTIPIITIAANSKASTTLALAADDPVLALIQRDLDSGLTVLIPRQRVEIESLPRIGWWAVDAVTRDAIDRMDTGGSAAFAYFQTITEYITVLRNGMVQANTWRRWNCIGSVVALVAALVIGCPFGGWKAGEAIAGGGYGTGAAYSSAAYAAYIAAFLKAPAACVAG
jgi:hypothetical protein